MAQIFKKSFKAGDSYREKQLGLISTSKVEIKWHEIPVFLVFCVSYNGVVIEWILLSFKDLQIWVN